MKKVFFLLIYSLLVLLLIAAFLIHFNFFNIKEKIYSNYPNLELRRILFSKDSFKTKMEENYKRRGIEFLGFDSSPQVANDYNVKFLPDTQFIKLNLDKKKLNFKESFMSTHSPGTPLFKSFFIETFKNKILIADYLGNIYSTEISNIQDKKIKSLDLQNITSNLSVSKVLDILVDGEKLYVSFIKIKDECRNLHIVVAKINFESLNFKNFFNPKECGEFVQGGRMQVYEHENKGGLLFTTSDSPNDKPNNKPQNDASIYGKILFIDFKNKKSLVFSKGHRNAQGLYVNKNLILSTEHGPKSGDEINKIIFNKNYGWPISSYGEKYATYNNEKPIYLKNHSSEGFEEPIFAFVPAIGISEVINLPNSFSKHFEDNYIVSSLYGRSLHRIKFDKKFSKIIFNEKIFIGQRIRDLKYLQNLNLILLALEDKGDLGILSR